MNNASRLWSNSSAWRWTLTLTLSITVLVVLISPWHPTQAPSTAQAQYNPPAMQAQPAPSRVMSTTGKASLDPEFDTAITLPTEIFSSDTELHVIGVYEGVPPDGETKKPWWSHCTGLSEDPAAAIACHQKYAGQRTTRTITVYLNRTTAPLVIALMAYEPIRWKIVLRPGVDLRKIILGGYHGQDIEGLPDSVPVDVHSYESSPCLNCSRQSDYFYAYETNSREYIAAMGKLEALTGLTPTSFQGTYKSDRFTISSGHTVKPRTTTDAAQVDQYSGSTFSNSVNISGKTLLLPDGVWQNLAHVENPSSRGNDDFLVLAQADKKQLSALLVIRVQTANDQQGFLQYHACNQPADYAKNVYKNESLGQQLCYWVNFLSTPWQQPIYRLAAARLGERGVILPASAFSTGFHKADSSMSITTSYYSFLQSKDQAPTPSDWSMSPWHPSMIANFPENSRALQQHLTWASDWFQIFKASQ
jgi:hypothetical protein